MPDTSPAAKSSPVLLIVAWAIVVIPTVWGFSYTVQNAMKIFTSPAPAATATPAPANTRP